MNLDRALQIHTAALALLGAIFLGLGSESLILPMALAAAAVLSVIVSNVLPWLRVNRFVANLVALAAVAWSMRDFIRMGAQEQLLAIADMLVYLQVVLLFQEKSGRVYWQLLVLSLLEVVVAAALNMGPQFGLLLAIYMALALATLVLLCMHRQWRGIHPSQTGVSTTGHPVKRRLEAEKPAATGALPIWQSLLMPPEQVLSIHDDRALSGIARTGLVLGQACVLAAATVFFAAVFFCATPRIGEGPWSGPRTRGMGATTGFTPEIALKRNGRVHLSRDLMMRVTLSSLADRNPVVLVGDPYFHGATLHEYVPEGNVARWIHTRRRLSSRFSRHSRTPMPSLAGPYAVRQDINLEHAPGTILFGLMPAVPLIDTPQEIHIAQLSNRIVRTPQSEDYRRNYHYPLGTLAVRNGRQLHGIPHVNPNQEPFDEYLLGVERIDLTAIDRRRLPGLVAKAEQVLRDEGLTDAGPLAKALALERHFHVPDAYHYALTISAHDPALDPVEDFVTNHRTGHCEYFASALALMLRSQGIPARLIVGFKGGELNSLGMYYQVQQRHAHAWVEAWMPPGEVPPTEIAGSPSKGGTWFRLDPTPGTEGGLATADEETPLHRVGEAFDYVELLWRDYVLSLNASRQRDAVFEPASNRAFGSLPSLAELPGLRSLSRMARSSWVHDNGRDARESGAFDWFSGAVVVGLIALAIGVLHGALWLAYRWRRNGRQQKLEQKRSTRPPAFYLKLESLLARMQLRRSRGQTSRELADAAAGRLVERGHGGELAHIPADVVNAYYRVRFGGAALDKNELVAIEQALAQLAPATSEKAS
jgi:transglutaminase-like putative cysteine protease